MPTPVSCRPAAFLALGFLAFLAACGGGSSGGGPGAPIPSVIGFSPTVAEYDPATGVQAPRFTNGALTLNTDPAHPGKIVVFFNPAATLDEDSFFLGRNPFLGLDQSALSVFLAIPGTGFVLVPVDAEVQADRIVLTPLDFYAPTLPAGQYTITVGSVGMATNGLAVAPAPVLHTFFVTSDPMQPSISKTSPEEAELGVSPTATIRVQFSEGIDRSTLDAVTIQVLHQGAVSATTLPAAPGYPRMQMDDDGATLPSNGHVVVWRTPAPFPTDGSIRVTVGQGPQVGGADLLDLNGNTIFRAYTFTFRVSP